MIRMLIIDDNKIIREHFQKMVDWGSKGFELVAVAGNGMAGWHEFQKHKPELVITDVKMPGMNGLELAKKIKEESPETMVVFISNYEDFNYLKSAISIGAYDYILKHETRGKIFDEKLEEIRKEITDENFKKRYYAESILFSALVSADEQKLEHAFTGNFGLLLIEQATVFPVLSELMGIETEENDVNDVVKSVYSCSQNVVSVARISKYRYAVLIGTDSSPEETAEAICESLYEKTNTKYYALILGSDISAGSCCRSYAANKDYINLKYFNQYDYIIVPQERENQHFSRTAIDTSELFKCIEAMNVNELCEILDNYTLKIGASYDYDALGSFLTKMIKYFKENEQMIAHDQFAIIGKDEIKFWTNMSEIMFWLKNKCIQLINAMETNPFASYSEAVKKAISYIQANYMKSNLTVGEIAESVNMDMYKLNRLIKQETGLTMIKWLTNTRIEKAKRLLESGEKVSDVCSRIGYLNMSYFSNVFKKQCGEAPIEYRRRAGNENAKNKKADN